MNDKCAFYEHGACRILRNQNCEGCDFFKTEFELEYGRRRAKARIDSLDEEARKSIYAQYYGIENYKFSKEWNKENGDK